MRFAGGTNLPDDLQQALDIIYRGGGSGKPITVPPPNFPQATVPPPRLPPPMMGVPPPAGQAPYGNFTLHFTLHSKCKSIQLNFSYVN